MEREAFIQTVEKLHAEVKVVEFCTDAHIQTGALMSKLMLSNMQLIVLAITYMCYFYSNFLPLDPDKGRFKEYGIKHSLDMWHGAKNLAKNIANVSFFFPLI